ncbi:ABC transporter permease subunit [Virgibacillus kekensis]|uniref:ABC transporter permease subunit n=1 Tax=Virgibacillus kekensis TaxID=202261 RepID=A0ABV9DGY7_9BACI
MVKNLFKNPLFVIGFSFIAIVMAASAIHWIFFDAQVPTTNLLYKDGKLVSASPHPPSLLPPFGSDRFGSDYLYLLLKGGIVTIGFALAAAALRMVVSTVVGLCYAFLFPRVSRLLTGISEAFQYLPTALIAYFILRPVLMQDEFTRTFSAGFWERIIFELLIFVLIALPMIATLIGNETSLILKKEFVTGSKVIGAGRWHLLKTHVLPHLAPKLWVNFGQQVVQVLILLVHLGLLNLFLGGTIPHHLMSNGFQSLTGDWAGLIGYSYKYFDVFPWLPLVPLGAFALTILALNYMIEGMKQVLIKDTKVRTYRKNRFAQVTNQSPDVEIDQFEPISQKERTQIYG